MPKFAEHVVYCWREIGGSIGEKVELAAGSGDTTVVF